MNIRNRATTVLVATLGVAALLAPTVSEAAPAMPHPGVTGATTARVGSASLSTSGSTAIPYYIYLDSFHISTTRALTASGDYRETRHYAGTNSPVGCGSNSSYDVSWRISLTPPPPPSTVTGGGGGGSQGGGRHQLN